MPVGLTLIKHAVRSVSYKSCSGRTILRCTEKRWKLVNVYLLHLLTTSTQHHPKYKGYKCKLKYFNDACDVLIDEEDAWHLIDPDLPRKMDISQCQTVLAASSSRGHYKDLYHSLTRICLFHRGLLRSSRSENTNDCGQWCSD
eukprot:m.133042 g.133042  ORF g.133042 m.133042 type:complete len:143 (+) comp9490_c0_seq2:87-515(+)